MQDNNLLSCNLQDGGFLLWILQDKQFHMMQFPREALPIAICKTALCYRAIFTIPIFYRPNCTIATFCRAICKIEISYRAICMVGVCNRAICKMAAYYRAICNIEISYRVICMVENFC